MNPPLLNDCMTSSPKTILFLTGTRADFGKIRSLIEQVDQSPDFQCNIFATGMHLLSRYDYTFEEIRKRGLSNIFLYMNQKASNSNEMDVVLANTILGLSNYISEFRPDLIVVHGDRVEALAGASVGALNNILVAHIEGGERSGTVDELIRHAVTKLSHLHFVSNEDARKRLIQLGEAPESIYVIGSPEVDLMLSEQLPALSDAKQRYSVDFDDYAIFLYHPVTTELDQLENNMRQINAALLESGWNFLVVYPNNDTGSDVIMAGLEGLKGHPRFRLFPSLRFEYFLTFLKNGRAIVGNSSSGVREAPVFGVPTINIGSRQLNRFKYPSIINVQEDRRAILQAMAAIPQNVQPTLHFGEGNSAEKFMAALQTPALWATAGQKQFQDIPINESNS